LPPKLASLLREAWWLLMAVAAVYLVLVLASYSAQDPPGPTVLPTPPCAITVVLWCLAVGHAALYFRPVRLVVGGVLPVAIAWGYRRMETLGFRLNPMTLAAMGGFFRCCCPVPAWKVSYFPASN
jgi:S-DNA-T family DNA segregation ATPase FtsK/SpoIIIE